jgi:hypothetical protein
VFSLTAATCACLLAERITISGSLPKSGSKARSLATPILKFPFQRRRGGTTYNYPALRLSALNRPQTSAAMAYIQPEFVKIAPKFHVAHDWHCGAKA